MNESIFTFFYGFAHLNRALDAAIGFIAVWYGFIILFVLFVYLYRHEDRWQGIKDIVVVLAVAVAAYVIAYALKNVFHTLRPFDALSSVHPLLSESGYAFPSGHATFFMALASILWFYHRRLAVFFGFSAILISVARVAAGIHWPIDILGGLFLGYAIGMLAYKIRDSAILSRYAS